MAALDPMALMALLNQDTRSQSNASLSPLLSIVQGLGGGQYQGGSSIGALAHGQPQGTTGTRGAQASRDLLLLALKGLTPTGAGASNPVRPAGSVGVQALRPNIG